jgi:colanic acid/amylovoran biosynthesis protein
MREAELYVAAGGGYLNDVFAGHATRVLGVLEVARSRRRAIALFGQGLGPMENPDLLRVLCPVLRGAVIIRLREGTAGRALLAQCGALDERAGVAGDDALELAWENRVSRLGDSLGLNVRLAVYTGLQETELAVLRMALREFTEERGVAIVSCPICFDAEGGDAQSVQRVAGDLARGQLESCDANPRAVIERIGQCRVLVTGSYHAGVFALAQGVPVLGLAKGRYYAEKFAGLLEQFGPACRVTRWDDAEFGYQLRQELAGLWDRALELRAGTLATAEAQIKAGRAGYAALPELLRREHSSYVIPEHRGPGQPGLR